MPDEQSKSAERNLIFCHMIRSVEVLEQAFKVRLESADFRNPALLPYRVIYQALEEYWRRKQLPTQPEMIHLVEQGLNAFPMVTDRATKTAMRLIKTAYAMPDKDIRPGYILEPNGPLQRLVDDVKIQPLERKLAEEPDRAERDRLRDQIRMLHEQTRVVQETHVDLFTDVQSMVDDHVTRPSGVDFIDKTIGGYTRSSAVGLIAESSGGKTMFGVQSLLEQVNKNRYSAAFFYEQTIKGDIAKRFYSYAARLHRDEIDKSYARMSDNTKAAIAAAKKQVNQYCRIYDMSGVIQGQGLGGPPEIDAMIGRLIRSGEFPVEFVLIDWLGPMVKRYHSGESKKDSKGWEQLDSALIQLVDISRRYNLTLIILHQLSPGSMQNKNPTYVPDWTAAHECKSFGLLLDYVFVFGRYEPESGCMWFSVAKARGKPKMRRLVQMRGGINKIVDAAEKWMQRDKPSRGRFFMAKQGIGSQSRKRKQDNFEREDDDELATP